MKINKFTIVGLALLLSVGIYTNNRTTVLRERQQEALKVPPPNTVREGPSYQRIKSFNFEGGGYNTYTDEEIRMLREKQSFKSNGGYIYTPGRRVPSREEQIEDYIRDNPRLIEDALEDY